MHLQAVDKGEDTLPKYDSETMAISVKPIVGAHIAKNHFSIENHNMCSQCQQCVMYLMVAHARHSC